MTAIEVDDVFVLRADGGQVQVRAMTSTDAEQLSGLSDRASEQSLHLRFFSANRDASRRYYTELCASTANGRRGVVAVDGDLVVGVACAEPIDAVTAEMALLIDDAYQGMGIGTVLLEHLMSHARAAGVEIFVADVLLENHAMLGVLRDLGYTATHQNSAGETHITWRLDPAVSAQAAVDAREAAAEAKSLRPIFRPRSLTVVGASNRERSVGGGLLHTLIAGGFQGDIYPVNPNDEIVQGLPAYRSVLDLPVAPELAVIAVPAADVLGVVEQCGERGVRGIVLVSSGFREVSVDGTYRERDVAACAHRYGMRLIGPNCLGVMNADPDVKLSATFSGMTIRPGGFGLASQSGALGIAVVAAAEQRGVGLSQFVSLGNKADVSGNDLLQWWGQDDATKVIGLYLESFGNPRKFARIARTVSRTKPILALKSGRTAAGERAGLSHTAAAAAPDAVVDALCLQAGVVRVDTLEELIDTAVLLDSQPLPDGPRVAIVGNSGGPQILAADAAAIAGLSVVSLTPEAVDAIRKAAPATANATNPVDIGGGMDAQTLRTVLGIVATSGEVDAVVLVVAPTASISVDEVRAIAASRNVLPVVPVVLGGAPAGETAIFEYPESAVRALARAWRYVDMRDRPDGILARRADAHPAPLTTTDVDGLLEPRDVAAVLAEFSIGCAPQAVVTSAEQATHAAAALGYPVAMKVIGLAHKTDIGGVRLDRRNADEVEQTFTELARLSPSVLIQPMAHGGTELIVGVVVDPKFGPLVMLGVGGVTADLMPGRSFRMAPLSDLDALEMVASLPEPIRLGFRGSPPISPNAVATVLQHVSELVCAHPEIVELDLNPVLVNGETATVLDAKITIGAPPDTPDPLAPRMA